MSCQVSAPLRCPDAAEVLRQVPEQVAGFDWSVPWQVVMACIVVALLILAIVLAICTGFAPVEGRHAQAKARRRRE